MVQRQQDEPAAPSPTARRRRAVDARLAPNPARHDALVIEAVRVRVPVLVIAGTDDPRTPLDASRRLSAAAPHPKGFWSVPGAAQTNLQRFAPAAYEARLLAFLDHYLRGVTTAEQG